MRSWKIWRKTDAEVIVEDIGWSDIGSWEALKGSITIKNRKMLLRGKVQFGRRSRASLDIQL